MTTQIAQESQRSPSSEDTGAEHQLERLSPEVRLKLSQHGFEPRWFQRMLRRLSSSQVRDNRVHGDVTPCVPRDLTRLPEPGAEAERLRRLGEAALAAGECALVVLAGGMATRMGGVVKALVEALPQKTFLELRLAEADTLTARYGRRPPLWLMTSEATDGPIREALGSRLDGREVAVFPQGLSLRVTRDGQLFFDAQGEPSLHAPGHGDLPDALARSGLLSEFVAGGGRWLLITNLDNLGGGLDPLELGFHIDGGVPVTCEVVEKVAGDRGGIPVRLDGHPVILEEFRLPESFDPTSVDVFSVNTFLVDAVALLELQLDWTYFVVDKQVDGQPVVQFERLINEITFALPTRYLQVPRRGSASRFLPVKDFPELEARQQDIEAVARARGMV